MTSHAVRLNPLQSAVPGHTDALVGPTVAADASVHVRGVSAVLDVDPGAFRDVAAAREVLQHRPHRAGRNPGGAKAVTGRCWHRGAWQGRITRAIIGV